MSQAECLSSEQVWTCAQCSHSQNPSQFYNCLRCMTPQNEEAATQEELPVCCLCRRRVTSMRTVHNPEPIAPCHLDNPVCCTKCNESKVLPARLNERHNRRVLNTVAADVKQWVDDRAFFQSPHQDRTTKYGRFGDEQSAVESVEQLEEMCDYDINAVTEVGPCFISIQHTQLPDYNRDNQIVQGVHLQQMSVHPAWRRRGIGTALVRLMVREAKQNRRFRYVFVESVSSEPMRRLMERMVASGEFEPHATQPRCYVHWL